MNTSETGGSSPANVQHGDSANYEPNRYASDRGRHQGESVLIPKKCTNCGRSMACWIERQVGPGYMCEEIVTCPHCRCEFRCMFPAPLLSVTKG